MEREGGGRAEEGRAGGWEGGREGGSEGSSAHLKQKHSRYGFILLDLAAAEASFAGFAASARE